MRRVVGLVPLKLGAEPDDGAGVWRQAGHLELGPDGRLGMPLTDVAWTNTLPLGMSRSLTRYSVLALMRRATP